LLPPFKFIEVGFNAGEEGGDFRLDFGEEGGLGGGEVVGGD